MGELILHHYDVSNFSEKVRLILGLKELSWDSVQIPATAPKPDYTPLTGGYRRTPALQIGADVYCDTRGIIYYAGGRGAWRRCHSESAGRGFTRHRATDLSRRPPYCVALYTPVGKRDQRAFPTDRLPGSSRRSLSETDLDSTRAPEAFTSAECAV